MSCRHTNREARRGAVGYWELVAAGEPFRLLFPVGTVLGILGVLMWPAHVWGWLPAYPGQFHARIMIEGFLTCFVVGFMGTALPRLLEVPRMTGAETAGFATALTAVAGLHFAGKTFAGDALFLLTMVFFLTALAFRFVIRRDTPPPGFLLVGMGMLSLLAGVSMQLAAKVTPALLPEWAFPLGRLLLYQGYLLLPVMGIGAFLLPRFFGLPNRQSFPESMTPPAGWWRRAAFALACGGAVMLGFVLEATGEARWGYALRAAAVAVYFFREVPMHRGGWKGGSLAWGLRVAFVSIPLGYVLLALWPQWSFTFLHVVFISGFGLLTFVVASRVVFGHSGQPEKFAARLWPVTALVILMVLAMLTRVSADGMPAIRLSHYAYAALVWAAAVAGWACAVLPGVRRAGEE